MGCYGIVNNTHTHLSPLVSAAAATNIFIGTYTLSTLNCTCPHPSPRIFLVWHVFYEVALLFLVRKQVK